MERIGLYDEESLDYEKNLHKIDSDFLVKVILIDESKGNAGRIGIYPNISSK